MRRRSILQWVLLTAVFISAIFIMSRFVNHDDAHAAAVNKQEQTSGSLRVVNAEGKVTNDCPLKHTTVKAEVSGFISRVTVTQDFENPFPDKIEAVYIFPLPQAAAVDDLTMRIGDRTIKGTIMRREDAQQAYLSAKRLGKVASLLDQERPNIFTQQVANILPGQQIRVVISYVETLKYEDGSYEWSFPMVVAPRYVPAADMQAEGRDAARISPPNAPDGMRAGHDISLELDLNAGVPILGVNSQTHETEVELVNDRRARVHLKDQNTIPNKDFVLKYRVAGSSINDAVLTHRSERGGFFTLILQPPQRVAPEDVMPKELVFVVDTSGSMSGFPIEKAKQTALLALDNLYPHDTFNVISFSGETRILFSEPVSATQDNLHKARKFLSGLKDDGGTEMMKAIKAALEPSDSQQHVRIVCFMTDGHVYADDEILAAVRKYRNARVFAMGFGDSPNRYLLDKMAEYGRGEVDYISEKGDTSSVARRFNERIRNPLLTDISIDWSGLPITDVLPRQAPDLYDVKPLTLSGRYAHGAKGTIRLKGKIAGEDFVREIPLELPNTEAEHEALATLWARRKVDDLVREEMSKSRTDGEQDQKRNEITQLGLSFKLMTKYTSLVAIDDVVFTGTDEARPVPVTVEAVPGSVIRGLSEQVTVVAMSSSSLMLSGDMSAQQISTNSVDSLPILARSCDRFVSLAPTAEEKSVGLGQARSAASGRNNNFTVDRVSANFGIAPGGETPGASASGNAPALTASGGANGLATLDAINEISIRTYVNEAEFGRNAGAQVALTTRAGTNKFHGSAFYFVGNDSFDASDWFANSRGLPKPPRKLNVFGGSLGGPIKRDKTFFFGAYEGMRFHQPMVGVTDVPSLSSRAAAPLSLRPFIDAFPIPNGSARPDGFAEFAASFDNPARHDVGSIRIDHLLNSRLNINGRYSFANSGADLRGADRLSLNTINQIRTRSQSATGWVTYTASPTMIVELFANYSRLRADGSYIPDQFGGATLPGGTFEPGSFTFDLNSRSAGWMIGDSSASVQHQFNIGGSVTKVAGDHTFRFGVDYRRLSPTIGVRTSQQSVLFDGMGQALTGVAGRINSLSHVGPQRPVFESFSFFAQDQWRVTKDLSLHYGMRWEVAPAPSFEGEQALTVDQVTDPAKLKLSASGGSLWKTTFNNFAPRVGFAYGLLRDDPPSLLLRGGVGMIYDVGHGRSGDLFANSVPFISGSSAFNTPFPAASLTTSNDLPFVAFDPQLKLPYTINWHVSLEKALGSNQILSASYIGSRGKRLLHTETLFDQNPDFPFLRLTTNRGNSDYRTLGVTFRRRMANGLAADLSYGLSQSLDNVTVDSERRIVMASSNPGLDRASSDFDVRHKLTGTLFYALPALSSQGISNRLTRNWTLNSIFNARSARPLNVVYMFPTSFGIAFLRPDSVNDVPLFILDPAAPGGRRINAEAFGPPADLEQGTLPRNSLRGFPLYQLDLGLQRKFNLSEDLALQIGMEAFNVFNHANFEDPLGNDLLIGSRFGSGFTPNMAFGESTSLAGRNLSSGGFASFYGSGGARTMRFSVRLLF